MDSRYLPGWFPSRLLPALIAVSAWAAAPDGAALYKTRCAGCHDGTPQARMPSHDELAAKTPDFVFKAMFAAPWSSQSAGSDARTKDAPSRVSSPARNFPRPQLHPWAASALRRRNFVPRRWGLEWLGRRSGQLALPTQAGTGRVRRSEAQVEMGFRISRRTRWPGRNPPSSGGRIVRRQRAGHHLFARRGLGLHLLDLRGGRRCAHRHHHRQACFGKVGRVFWRYRAQRACRRCRDRERCCGK